MTYVVINMIASALFLTAIAFVYAALGTVNMADLAEKMGTVPDGLRSALGLLFLVVFGIKAAVFPLFSWLPDSYPTARAPVVAVFAGLLTKVGVYCHGAHPDAASSPATCPPTLLLDAGRAHHDRGRARAPSPRTT